MVSARSGSTFYVYDIQQAYSNIVYTVANCFIYNGRRLMLLFTIESSSNVNPLCFDFTPRPADAATDPGAILIDQI